MLNDFCKRNEQVDKIRQADLWLGFFKTFDRFRALSFIFHPTEKQLVPKVINLEWYACEYFETFKNAFTHFPMRSLVDRKITFEWHQVQIYLPRGCTLLPEYLIGITLKHNDELCEIYSSIKSKLTDALLWDPHLVTQKCNFRIFICSIILQPACEWKQQTRGGHG